MKLFRKKKHPAFNSANEKFPGLDPLSKLNAYRPECSWLEIYYPITKVLLSKFEAPRILEIGVAYGYHAESLLESSNGSFYVGVDPYRAGYDPEDFFVSDVQNLFGIEDPQSAMDTLGRAVKSNLDIKFPGRATLIQSDVRALMENSDLGGKFDFIWIDGDHTYDAVSIDLDTCWGLLDSQGIMAGDDYNWPGVESAVSDFCTRNKVNLHLITNVSKSNYKCFVITKP